MKGAARFACMAGLLASALLSSACGPIILETPVAANAYSAPPSSAAAATATPTQSPSPTPGLTLSPAATEQGGWSLLTAPPSLLNAADPAPEPAGYHVVHVNGRQGIVDGKGKTVLKADFSSICVISGSGNKALFFAVPYDAATKNTRRKSSGFLYNVAGKPVSRERFSNAYAVGDSLAAVCGEAAQDPVYGGGEDDETGESGNGPTWISPDVGAVAYDGRQVIPRKYFMICRFGDTLAALGQGKKKGAYAVDFYGLDGALKGTMPTGGAYDPGEGALEGMQPEGDLLVFPTSGKLFGVLDVGLKWAVPPQYDEIGYNSVTGQFVVRRGGLYGVLGRDGAVIVPVTYQAESMEGNVNVPFYSFYTAGAVQMFDSFGREVFRSTNYDGASWSEGVIIASKGGKSFALDTQGRNLLPGADNVQGYHAEGKLFECRDASGNVLFYSESGKKLALPKARDIGCIAPDRFIINTDAGSGLCDGQGKWLMKPQYAYIEPVGGGMLLYAKSCAYNEYFDTNVVCGLARMDGRILTKPVYYAFEACGSRYFAETVDVFGMLNGSLKWAWSVGRESPKQSR